MKPIKIHKPNAEAIEAALKAANGTAVEHTFTTFEEVSALAEEAEKQVSALLPIKGRPGARYVKASGDSVPNSYRGRRVATGVVLERHSLAWYLVSVERVMLFQTGGGPGQLCLTKEQDVEARERFASQYFIDRSIKA